jgi:hypothetical protein
LNPPESSQHGNLAGSKGVLMRQSGGTFSKRVMTPAVAGMRLVHRNAMYRPTNNLELAECAPQYEHSPDADSWARTGPVPKKLVPMGRVDGRVRGELVTATVYERPLCSSTFHDIVSENPAPRIFFHRGSRPAAVLARVLHGVGCPCFAGSGVALPSVNGAASADR